MIEREDVESRRHSPNAAIRQIRAGARIGQSCGAVAVRSQFAD
jgi:hypothetical protein